MNTENKFLKRRLEESIFHFWLMKKYSEKNMGDSLSKTLADDYKRKYEHLMSEYLRLFSDVGSKDVDF